MIQKMEISILDVCHYQIELQIDFVVFGKFLWVFGTGMHIWRDVKLWNMEKYDRKVMQKSPMHRHAGYNEIWPSLHQHKFYAKLPEYMFPQIIGFSKHPFFRKYLENVLNITKSMVPFFFKTSQKWFNLSKVFFIGNLNVVHHR